MLSLPSFMQAANSTPDRMSYQGYLTNASGTALAANSIETFDMIFRIYDSSSGGTLLFAEEQAVSVSDGSFSILLGEGNAYTDDVPAPGQTSLKTLFSPANVTAETYIEITVDEDRSGTFESDETPITPRLQLVTAPYAFMANTAVELYDGSVTYDGSEVTVGKSLDVTGSATINGGMTVIGSGDVDNNTAGIGVLQISQGGSGNLRLDTNEIQAVSDASGTASKLHLNHNGGDLLMGSTSGDTEVQGSTILLDGNTTVEGSHSLTVGGSMSANGTLNVLASTGVTLSDFSFRVGKISDSSHRHPIGK